VQRGYARCCKDTADIDVKSRGAAKDPNAPKTEAEKLADLAAAKAQAKAAQLRAQIAAKAAAEKGDPASLAAAQAAAKTAAAKAEAIKPSKGTQQTPSLFVTLSTSVFTFSILAA
jgi:hypothetical protein